MEKILVIAALACHPGDRLVDWHDRLPAGDYPVEFVITVSPFYTRVLIYRPGHPGEVQRCCGGKHVSIVRALISDGRFCVGQSQPQMSFKLRLSTKPDVHL